MKSGGTTSIPLKQLAVATRKRPRPSLAANDISFVASEKDRLISEFSNFFDQVVSERDAAKTDMERIVAEHKEQGERIESQLSTIREMENQVIEQLNQMEQMRTKHTDEVAKLRRGYDRKIEDLQVQVGDLRQMVADQRSQIVTLENENASLARDCEQQANELQDLQSELDTLKRQPSLQRQVDELTTKLAAATGEATKNATLVQNALDVFKDYITHDASSFSIPMTSGRILSLDGLIKIWFHDHRFNGDVWYSFICPVSGKTSKPLADLSVASIWNQVGVALGLKATPPYYFRYNLHPSDSTEHENWGVYSVADQLCIFAQMVKAYHDRDRPGEKRYNVCVKSSHLISISIVSVGQSYDMTFSLTVVEAAAKAHEIQLVLTEDAYMPLVGCNFIPSCTIVDDD